MNKLSHIAFIMDGNGRWGKKRGKSRNFGHINGVNTVKKIVKESIKLKIPFVSFYVFSTENWKRPKKEINFLFNLIGLYFKRELNNVKKNGIKINIIGNLDKIPIKLKNIIKQTIKETKKNKKIVVNLAINYGSKNEIVNSVKKLKKTKISEESINRNLQTRGFPDPDILIRTGGKKRLSNFMLWQLAYSEIYFLDKLWPDFTKKDLNRIVSNFRLIKRNFGAI